MVPPLNRRSKNLAKLQASRLVVIRESRTERTVEVEHRKQFAVADDRNHQLAIRRAIAGDVSGKGVDIVHTLYLPGRGGGAADALAERDTNAGGPALERSEHQLAANVAVEAGPVEVRHAFPDQRGRIGHIGDAVRLPGDQAFERRCQIGIEGGLIRRLDPEIVHPKSSSLRAKRSNPVWIAASLRSSR